MTNDEANARHSERSRGIPWRKLLADSSRSFDFAQDDSRAKLSLLFVFAPSSFSSCSAHPGNFWQTKHSFENLVRHRVFDLVDSNRIGDVEAAGFRTSKRFQMRAATEHFADVVSVGADIKAFAAQHAEIDFGQCDPVDRIAIDVDKAWLALHYFSFARQLVQRHATVFFCGNHGRQLVEIASELFERDANLIFVQLRHRTLLDDPAFTVLRIGRYAKYERADVFFILAHE